jgi:hypothetical protein
MSSPVLNELLSRFEHQYELMQVDHTFRIAKGATIYVRKSEDIARIRSTSILNFSGGSRLKDYLDASGISVDPHPSHPDYLIDAKTVGTAAQIIQDGRLKQMICAGFDAACAKSATEPDNRRRSGALVCELAAQFRQEYPRVSYRTFSLDCDENHDVIAMNELSFDIQVCKFAIEPLKELPYVTRSIWQMESEFAKNSRESLTDFSKLVCGAADNKLFIGPLVSERERQQFQDVLLPAAACCSGTVYAAFVPHPAEWGTASAGAPTIFRFKDRAWLPID